MRYSRAGGLIERHYATELRVQFSVCNTRQTRCSTVRGIARENMPPWAKDNAKIEENYQSLSARVVRG